MSLKAIKKEEILEYFFGEAMDREFLKNEVFLDFVYLALRVKKKNIN